jgi:hypothetical protein
MSRLDDELKLMFQREEPSSDFAERVLARIQVEVQPKETFWQRLLAFFQPNAMRWAVATTAILLIAIIGFMQYQRLHKNTPDTTVANGAQTQPADNPVASGQPTLTKEPNRNDSKTPESSKTTGGVEQKKTIVVNHKKLYPSHSQRLKFKKESVIKNPERVATQPKSEGEIAKEQLLKALFIASATVNEAKKLAIGGD